MLLSLQKRAQHSGGAETTGRRAVSQILLGLCTQPNSLTSLIHPDFLGSAQLRRPHVQLLEPYQGPYLHGALFRLGSEYRLTDSPEVLRSSAALRLLGVHLAPPFCFLSPSCPWFRLTTTKIPEQQTDIRKVNELHLGPSTCTTGAILSCLLLAPRSSIIHKVGAPSSGIAHHS